MPPTLFMGMARKYEIEFPEDDDGSIDKESKKYQAFEALVRFFYVFKLFVLFLV
jgi:hypothetical protein